MSASRELHEKLHLITLNALIEKIEAGEATAADLNVARQLLKDNGVGLGVAPNASEMGKLASQLPFQSVHDMDDSVIN